MLLLDTCALIWVAQGSSISQAARTAIGKALRESKLYLSPISAWEIGILVRRGKLTLDMPVEVFVNEFFSRPGISIAALTPEIAVRSSFLPDGLPNDPADRILAATAATIGARLVTRDQRLLEYGAKGFVPVMAC